MRFLCGLVAAASLLGQSRIPPKDLRNVDPPNTDTHFKARRFSTRAEWETHKEHLKKQILSAAGMLPMFPKSELHPQIFGRIENRDYSIEKVLLETMPGYYLGGNLYRPLKAPPANGFPAVLSPHGHWTYGRLEHTDVASVPARAINLARQGYVVFAYDMVGYNDTIQTPHDFGDKPVEQLWGFGPLGLQLWNSIRVLDFLESLPGVNRNQIGVTGASGGATQTMLLGAVDDRIQFAAPANMVSLIMQGGSLCENAPGLRHDTNNVEIASMMAPRPMIMTSATGDWTVNMPKEEFPAVRAIYELYDKASNLGTLHLDAPHNYNKANREAMYAFFGKHVLGIAEPEKLKERSIRAEKLQDMLVLHNRKLPDNALSFAQLFEAWIRLSRAQFDGASKDALKERLTLALDADWPAAVIQEQNGERVVLGRPGKGDRIPAIWIKGSNPPALVVHPDGAEAARKSPEVAALQKEGRSVLMIDAFQTGSTVAPRDRSVKMFLTFNQSDDANRVQDILTSLAWLKTPQTKLVGLGKAAVWCLFAAAVAKVPVDLQADVASFSGTDQEYVDRFFIPGIQRAGGLAAARRVLGR